MRTAGGTHERDHAAPGADLVERDDLLADLDGLLRSAAEGHSQTVVVRGPVATGKTAVIREFVTHCAASGTGVLTANGSLAEQSCPQALVRQLFDDLGGGPREPAGEPPAALRMGELLHKALVERLGSGPLVVCVDDLHFADDASLQNLLYVQRRLVAAPILFLFGVADHLSGRLTEFDAELTRRARIQSLDVGALSRAGVEAMARWYPGDDRLSGQVEVLHRASGGNPLLLKGLLKDAVADGVVRPGGRGFRDAVSACLYRGGAGMRAVAQALALLREQGDHELVPQLLVAPADDVDQSVKALVAAGVLGPDGGYHSAAARTAVLETMAPAIEAGLRGKIAELLHEKGAAGDAVARHLVATKESPAPWAVEVLVEAAEEARVAGELDRAAAYLEFALRAEVDEHTRARSLGLLARIKWHTNPRAAASYLPSLREALLAGHLGDQDAGRLAGYLLWHGRVKEAAGVVEWMESVRAGRTPATQDALNATRHWMQYLHPRRDTALAADPAERGRSREPDATGDLRLHAATALVSVLTGGVGADCSSAEFVLQSTEMGSHADESVFAALLALVYADRLDRAGYWCENLLGHARRHNLTTLSAIVLGVSADIALRQGRLRAAEARANEALALISDRGWGVVIAYPQSILVAAASGLGRYAEAAEHLRRPMPAGTFETAFGLNYLYARGLYALRTERHFAALEDFQRCGRLMREWGLDRAVIAPWRLGAGLVHAALSRTDEAKALFDEQSRRRRGEPGAMRGVSLRLLARLSEPDARAGMLRESVALLRKSGHALELALSLAELSNERYSRGDTKQAQEGAREAMEIAEDCEAVEDVRRILCEGYRFDLADLLGDEHVQTRYELSNAEGRVAALAASGMTNRQIGTRLHLSTSTVEQHLTRVYRKLQVTRREDLARLLWPARTETA
ncbi:AAA family ATPase [Amycolatopsis sp. PS_44_ISF1]|uniref:AAA family ATPase n=1 Tax=Amycolatopsis sp. PS_44_ISF1 TaxID=2974917 RepID=UPI0028DFD296|nr:AAA family ATPase [Amycolatopsis sp. PS_44_ISF1]MDT8912315.1 AAA family ATPase [Amycolatopsis sp. PS_44_ISF1]